MFIADIYNHRIRRISSDGIIATVAGGAYGFSGDGGPALQASLSYPIAVTADATGNVYVADAGNNAIRVLRPRSDSASIGTTK